MVFQPDIIDKLKRSFENPLPGLDAHLEMAPPLFHKFTKTMKIPENAREAAVLLLLYVDNGKLYIPFMRRTEDGRVHGGQISFPGGRVEESDPDYTFTAIREAEEEFGIKSESLDMVGAMSQLYIVPSNFIVHPRVAFLNEKPNFIPNEEEVAEIIEVELGVLLEKSTRQLVKKKLHTGHEIEVPSFYVNSDTIIWGGTSMMLAEFLAIFENIYQ
ncbi:MAG: CoA pyrophosphatase [Bacteroidia bacterium]|nr:CoA pyrophosphatase [Bacteroidia bacterium]